MTRFDIVLGHYMFYNMWYSGQTDPFYARLCRITRYFNPGRCFSETRFFENKNGEYDMAHEVYDALCQKHEV